jgi:UDP-GlcNAc:undecaprenyl-phosphate GlcNAc-1-phosphate transferase
MLHFIIGGILAFCLTFYTIPVIIRVAIAKKLFDEPDYLRKIHIKPIPSLGGLGVFIGFMMCLLLTVNIKDVSEFQYYIATFLIIFFVGVKDDILILSATKKFIVQFLVAAILLFKANLLITNMQNFLGFSQINPMISYLLTFFTIVVTINAFNLIDGVDGLAGSLGFISCAVFGTYFLINGNTSYAILGYGFAASILAFLIYNFHPAKIFMGDTGSLLLGLVNSILVIKFIETAPYYKVFSIDASPAVGFGILLLPLMDTLRVFGIRIINGRSPFSPDRNHIHHLLLDRGMNHMTVTVTCAFLSIFFTVSAFLLQSLGSTWLIVGLGASFFAVISGLYFTKRKAFMKVIKREKVYDVPAEEETRVSLNTLLKRRPKAVAEEG